MTKKKNESKGMSKEKNKSMRKNILNFSYSTLHSMLKYKAMHLDRLVLFVDSAYTTQECSCCGKRNKMKLSDRIYSCDCGFSLNRDWNSAINIRSKGINLFEELNSVACSGVVYLTKINVINVMVIILNQLVFWFVLVKQ